MQGLGLLLLLPDRIESSSLLLVTLQSGRKGVAFLKDDGASKSSGTPSVGGSPTRSTPMFDVEKIPELVFEQDVSSMTRVTMRQDGRGILPVESQCHPIPSFSMPNIFPLFNSSWLGTVSDCRTGDSGVFDGIRPEEATGRATFHTPLEETESPSEQKELCFFDWETSQSLDMDFDSSFDIEMAYLRPLTSPSRRCSLSRMSIPPQVYYSSMSDKFSGLLTMCSSTVCFKKGI
jgi:hypothetical protein